MELSRSAMKITASATLEIDSKAKKMKADGIDVVGFGAGEPDFDTPSFIIDAAKKLWMRVKLDILLHQEY